MSARIFRLGRIVCVFALLVILNSCAMLHKEVPVAGKPAKVAVVLGAGASRGFAHIGVLKILQLNKIPVHMVVGSSVGSFVGSLYAYGYSPYDLQTIALNLQKDDLVDYTLPDNGFIKGDKLESFINMKVKYTPINKFRTTFYAVSTNIQTGEEMIFGRGNTGKAVRASCSIPGVVQPPIISGKMYVDGGVVSPLAVDAARRYGADVVIAVDISSILASSAPSGTVETIMQAIDIMYNKISTIQMKNADIVIKPNVGYIGSSDFSKRHEAIMEGEKAANAALPAINRIISQLRREGRLP